MRAFYFLGEFKGIMDSAAFRPVLLEASCCLLGRGFEKINFFWGKKSYNISLDPVSQFTK